MENKKMYGKENFFQQPYKKPFLFYVLFDTDTGNLSVSKSSHNIDGMPEELKIVDYSRTNEKQKNYIECFYADYFGKLLKEKNDDLYEKVILY